MKKLTLTVNYPRLKIIPISLIAICIRVCSLSESLKANRQGLDVENGYSGEYRIISPALSNKLVEFAFFSIYTNPLMKGYMHAYLLITRNKWFTNKVAYRRYQFIVVI
jgi:hypothetical protein